MQRCDILWRHGECQYRNQFEVRSENVRRLSGSCRRQVEGAHRHLEEAAEEQVVGFILGPGKDMLGVRAELTPGSKLDINLPAISEWDEVD